MERMNAYRVDVDEEMSPEELAAEAAFEADLAARQQQLQKAEIGTRREKQRLADEERQRQWDERCRAIDEAIRETDEHHRAFGAFLKIGEAYVTKELYTRYHRKSGRKVARQLEKFIKAFQETRAVMDYQRIRDLQTRALYNGPQQRLRRVMTCILATRSLSYTRMLTEPERWAPFYKNSTGGMAIRPRRKSFTCLGTQLTLSLTRHARRLQCFLECQPSLRR